MSEEDRGFASRLHSSLFSLRVTHQRILEGLDEVHKLLGRWSSDTVLQRRALHELPRMLAREVSRSESEGELRDEWHAAEASRAALADALSAVMEAWLQTAEGEASALALPLRQGVVATAAAPSAPEWLDSAPEEVEAAHVASRERLRGRGAELQQLGPALGRR